MAIHQNSKTNNQEKAVTLGTFGALLATTLVSGGVMAGIPASADDSTKSSSVSVTVSSACTMEIDSDTHSTTINPGQRMDGETDLGDIGLTTLTATCNDPNGYAIYAVGYTGDTWKNNAMSTSDNSYSFNTHAKDTSYASDSHWYMKLIQPTGSNISIENGYNTYSRIPGTSDGPKDTDDNPIDEGYVKVASYDAATHGISSADVQISYGAYITSSQAAGTYTGKVKYTLVHPSTTTPPVASDCNPNGTTINTGSGTDIKCMQDINDGNKSSILASMTTDQQYQLNDKRDGKTYWVAKLKDGNVWMTQNLDLDLSASTALTSEDTDLSTYGSEAYTAGNGYSCSGSAADCSDGIIAWTPARSTIDYVSDAETALGEISNWTNDYDTPYSVDAGDWYWSGSYYVSSDKCPSAAENSYLGCNYATKNPSQYGTYFSTTPYATNGAHGHVGNYYNWPAAIATNDGSGYTTSTYSDTSKDPGNSICPAGWRLPKAGDSAKTTNEFSKLNAQYNSGAANTDAGLIAAPLFFTRSGGVWTSALYYAGNYGYYWSSTVESAQQARSLLFNSGGVYPVNLNNRDKGYSLRCVAR